MQLVRRGDEPHGIGLAGDAGHVCLLALAPGRLRILEGVGVTGRDPDDLIAEPLADVLQPRLATLILGGVVQEGGDDLVFGTTVLADDGRDREQVRDVGDAGSFARLIPMNARRIFQGLLELPAVRHGSQTSPSTSSPGSRIQPSFGSHSGGTP